MKKWFSVTIQDREIIRKYSKTGNCLSNYELSKMIGCQVYVIRRLRDEMELEIERVCRYCNKIFSIRASLPSKQYCSDECANVRFCRFCGNKFQRNKSNTDQIFCGVECRNNHWRTKGKIPRKITSTKPRLRKYRCGKCNDEFNAYSRRTYCGTNGKCLKDVKYCEVCGKKLPYSSRMGFSYPSDRFCSLKCYKETISEIKHFCSDCGIEINPKMYKQIKNGKEYKYKHFSQYCEKCGIKRIMDNVHNQRLKENNVTRVFAKWILWFREKNYEDYLSFRRECIEHFGKKWKIQFDRRLSRYYLKLFNELYPNGTTEFVGDKRKHK